MEKNKSNRITELPDSDFLSFLYSERDREESLNSYQGWNLWAVIGAMITVACAIYSIICNHQDKIGWLNTSYIASGIIGFCFCYRSLVKFILSFLERRRGVDYRKVKYLKEVAPIPYLIVALLCSVTFATFFPLANSVCRWGLLSILWIWMAVANVLVLLNVYLGKDSIVLSYVNGILFPNVRLWIWIEMAISSIYSIIWFQSFRLSTGQFIGSPDFEVAACLASLVLLLYLLLKIKMANRKSSVIDVLLDEYVYKDAKREVVFQKLQANRMGYGIVEICKQELDELMKYAEAFDVQKKQMESIKDALANDSIDVCHIREEMEKITKTMDYIKDRSQKVRLLDAKMVKVKNQVKEIVLDEDFDKMLDVGDWMLEKADVMTQSVGEVMIEFRGYAERHACGNLECPLRNKGCS
jgi:hypothetical protein